MYQRWVDACAQSACPLESKKLNVPCLAICGTSSRSVNVKVETTDVNATYMITGATSLVTGSQDMVITVTAQNGDSATYTVTLNVLELSKNTDLDADAGIEINGEAIDFELVDSANFYDVERTATTIGYAY